MISIFFAYTIRHEGNNIIYLISLIKIVKKS